MQLFVNDLTVIDFSYLCEQRGIVGESWIVDVLLTGDLNNESMVLDFGIVKKQIKAIIDDAVDHKLLLPMQSTKLSVINSPFNAGHELLDFSSARGSYFLQSPQCAFAKIDALAINEAKVLEHLQQIILTQLPSNVLGLQLTLRPENITGAYYHYSHGLKKHQGNCQRIAHGHRSPIHLYKNGVRNSELEKTWCEKWQDIYIASETDRIEKSALQVSNNALQHIENSTEAHQYFSYNAPQGRFDIAVPSTVLSVVDCDSTVELLADFIYRQLKQQNPNDALKVVAFEGVGKGAIAGDF
jgi:hypothetical protein